MADSSQSIIDQLSSSMLGPQSGSTGTQATAADFLPGLQQSDQQALGNLSTSNTGGSSNSGGSSDGSFWDNFKQGFSNTMDYLNYPFAKPGQSVAIALADAIQAGKEAWNGQPNDVNTFQDLGNLWATPSNSVTTNAISRSLGESDSLKNSWYSPSNFLDVASTFATPTGWIGDAGKAITGLAGKGLEAANAAMRGEGGFADALSSAQNTATQGATDSFNTQLQKAQTNEATRSAINQNFSLSDMLNRTPNAQNTFVDTVGKQPIQQEMSQAPSLSDMLKPTGNTYDFSNLFNHEPAPSFNAAPPDDLYKMPFTQDQANLGQQVALKQMQQAVDNQGYYAVNNSRAVGSVQNAFPEWNMEKVGSEYRFTPPTPSYEQQFNQALQDEFNRLKDIRNNPPGMLDKGGLIKDDSGYVQGSYKPTSGNPQWYRDFYAQNGRKPTNSELMDIGRDHLLNGEKDRYFGDIPPWKPEGNVSKGLNDAESLIQHEPPASNPINSMPEQQSFVNPFTAATEESGIKGYTPDFASLDKNLPPENPMENVNPNRDVLNKDKMNAILQDRVNQAKGQSTLEWLQKMNDAKNPLQKAYSGVGDWINGKFSLQNALGDKFPAYYDFLTSKDYRNGQMAKDIMDTFNGYSPEDLKSFRYARDAGDIGEGHKFEDLNNAYQSLLDKYTSMDNASGLQRGELSNYVPRMVDVDKENMAAVKRSEGSDSLGGYAEDRTDKRTLKEITSESGRDPYIDDMYHLTMSRLRASINAQESRSFIHKMINSGEAVKFENKFKATTSPLYNKDLTGLYVDPLTKETYLMPKQTAAFLNKENDWSEMSKLGKGLDAINQVAKRSMLFNPFVHLPHNILTSLPTALNEAGARGWNMLRPSWWKKGMKKGNESLIDEMERMGVLHPEYMQKGGETAPADLAHATETQDLSPFSKWTADLKHEATTGNAFERANDTLHTAFRPLDALTWKPEHVARVAVYKTAKEMGATPEQASEVINKNFGTNTKTLTPFEKNVMTRVFTFYPWMKHIGTWGARNFTQHFDNFGHVMTGLNTANQDFSGHPMSQNPQGKQLMLDMGMKDQQGNHVFVNPYLPTLEGIKMATELPSFLYNRMNQTVSTPINLIANKEFGPLTGGKNIVDDAKVDAGIQNPWAERSLYVGQRFLPILSPFFEDNHNTDSFKTIVNGLGARTSNYNPDKAALSEKIRQENAAKAIYSYNKKNGIPISSTLKQQERGKVPFQIGGTPQTVPQTPPPNPWSTIQQ